MVKVSVFVRGDQVDEHTINKIQDAYWTDDNRVFVVKSSPRKVYYYPAHNVIKVEGSED